MDAKVRRAAVSAAIRVTISTTLIGCGGSVTSDAIGPSPAGGSSDTETKPVKVNTPTPTPTPSSDPAPILSAGGGGGGGGVADAGAPAAGEGNLAGAPALDACSVIESCQNVLDADPQLASPMAQGCCSTVIYGLMELQKPPFAACWSDLSGRFLMSQAHQTCCASEKAWLEPACTPWGPPVPPELPESALRAWESAA